MINSARSIRRILLVLTLSVGLHLVVALAAVSAVKYWSSPASSGAKSSRMLSLSLVSSSEESFAEASPNAADTLENTASPTPLPPDPEPAAASLSPPIASTEPALPAKSEVSSEPESAQPVAELETDVREEFSPMPLLSDIESQSVLAAPPVSELSELGGAASTGESSNVGDQVALEDDITLLLRSALAAQLRYPERLRRRQTEDCVTARVSVAMTGAVSLLAITEASRQREFNQEVTRAIGALPDLDLDHQTPAATVQITVPVCFSLTAS